MNGPKDERRLADLPIIPGQTVELPAGYQVRTEMEDSELQSTMSYIEYRAERLREIGRPLQLPKRVVTDDLNDKRLGG
jgi:hypothetical protein